ncbi:YeeE/YedE family protein [Vibrio sp. FNV 38]|nr:YeeE/YedE family protein [Vibrio sp. FNV 38]
MKSTFLFSVIALISGLFFGFGMTISGMVDPVKVIGFLDLAGDWDPSLAFVMGGALLVFAPSYALIIKPRAQPIIAQSFSLNVKKQLDRPLIVGAILFGLGWGIAGICPGPAITSLPFGNIQIGGFVASMLIGSLIAKRFQ